MATYSNVDHPLTTEPEDPTRAAVLIVTSDRGLAGAYSSSVLKEAERLAERLRGEGKEVVTYLTGRKGEAYYQFRQRADRAGVDRLLRPAALRERRGRSARR